MAQFMVTAAELRNKAEQLQQQNEQFKTLEQNLRDQEQGLHGLWEGEARDVFSQEFQRTAGCMESFAGGITNYINALQDIIVKYEQAEAKNVQTASVKG